MGEFSPIHWIVVLIVLGLYFLPYIVAGINKKRNAVAIGALNFFLGWTVVGWVVSFVWALSRDDVTQPQQVIVNTSTPNQVTPAQKKCPDCAEMVLIDANKCRFCGHVFGLADE